MKFYKYKDKCNVSGRNIRRLREATAMSQEQLAASLQLKGLNLNQKAISRIETGERVVADYELLFFSDIFDVSIESLLCENNLG
ncbi:MAG: helix-turn-helix transcriptional regulator [Lachnospiraceae bacterium]|nr:helix-turn-helix transcriptional regulator [Lachnospiraceae bacterium]